MFVKCLKHHYHTSSKAMCIDTCNSRSTGNPTKTSEADGNTLSTPSSYARKASVLSLMTTQCCAASIDSRIIERFPGRRLCRGWLSRGERHNICKMNLYYINPFGTRSIIYILNLTQKLRSSSKRVKEDVVSVLLNSPGWVRRPTAGIGGEVTLHTADESRTSTRGQTQKKRAV